MEADERPVRRHLVSLEGAIGVIADHQRRTGLPQRVVDLAVEPARMAELEAVATGRKLREGTPQPLIVALEVLRKLPQDGAELRRRGERLDPLPERLDAAVEVGEPLDVGEIAARFDCEGEAGRTALDPARHGAGGGKPVEGVVELNRVESLRVELEPSTRGCPAVQPVLPVAVVPPRAADQYRLQGADVGYRSPQMPADSGSGVRSASGRSVPPRSLPREPSPPTGAA